MKPGDPGFEEHFLEDCKLLQRRGPVKLDLDASFALTLVGQLHLALRHPGNRGPSAVETAKFLHGLISQLAISDTIRQGLQAGNDPRFDTEVPAAHGHAAVRPQTVCLCGSTRFYKEFQEANCRETLCGRIVLSVGCFTHTSFQAHGTHEKMITEEQKAILDELHLRKIDASDMIFVVNGLAPRCKECGAWQAYRPSATDPLQHPYLPTCEHRGGFESAPYIGDSTARELRYAREHGKRVRWLNIPNMHALPGEGK